MAYQLIIKQEAISDTSDAYFYYEAQQTGLGDRFLNMLLECYQKLEQNPQFYSFVAADKEHTMRDLKIRDFPFLIIFDVHGSEVIVYAVHNCYKRPISFP